MTGFSADWLALRAGADDRARHSGVMMKALDILKGGKMRVTDLGGGSGATMRVLSPYIPKAKWRILDHDPALLDLIEAGPQVKTVVADLAQKPKTAFRAKADLITASAFFDLVSGDWMDGFVRLLAEAQVPLYAALTYDGRESWSPEPPSEANALATFHADMQRDKGFGPALGGAAPRYLTGALLKAGFEVTTVDSDWNLTRPRDAALIEELASGGAAALRPMMPPDDHKAWARGRAAAQKVVVGHKDILAVPKSA